MERTIAYREQREAVLKLSDVYCIVLALFAIGIPTAFRPAFLFVYIAALALRNTRECVLTILTLMVCFLLHSMRLAYIYALGFLLYFTILQAARLLQANIYRLLPYISSALVAIYSFMEFALRKEVIVLPLVTFLLVKEMLHDTRWINHDEFFYKRMKELLILGGMFALVGILPNYAVLWYMLGIALICGLTSMEIAIGFLVVCAIFLSSSFTLPLALMGLCVMYQQRKQFLFLCVLGGFYFIPMRWEMYVGVLVLAGILLLKQPVYVDQKEPIALPQNQQLKRNIVNYAGIFQLLADYYTSISDVESELLFNMAQALEYQADMLVNEQDMDRKKQMMKEVLEEYRYRVHHIHLEEEMKGIIQMELELGNMQKKELKLTVLPLLENLTHQKLQIETVLRHRWLPKTYRILVTNKAVLPIETVCDSLGNAYTENGDSHSVFRFQQSLVCMISDGMGNGERALQSSRLVTSMFQRMVTGGMSQNNAIRCINKLVQSDTFATLDVLCFHESEQKLYISKSAACPTYLLRQGKLQEINGSALPIGIVTQMQPDCFCMEYLPEDEFLMVSDGISHREIEAWLVKRSGKTLDEQAKELREILHQNKRFDDSTFIFIKVGKIT